MQKFLLIEFLKSTYAKMAKMEEAYMQIKEQNRIIFLEQILGLYQHTFNLTIKSCVWNLSLKHDKATI